MRVATLHKAPHFNHTVAIDTFYLEWDKEKKAVFSILDEFSRYGVDCEIKEETAEMEIGLFESVWSKSFGYPKVLRLDASGPHQGDTFAEWASNHGIKLDLIPRGAHHRLGILERNHAVRRKMLETFKQEVPDCSFEKALLVTAHQRNRLSSVKGSTPATVAFGYVPSEGGVMDDPGPESFGDQADLPRILEIKQQAAIAFHKANQDLALRAAALHRSRIDEDELMVGDWVFYWKPQTHKLDPFRWRGPALVVAVECTTDRATTIYWVVHGSSLVRTTRQQLRHETTPERYERQARPAAENDLKRPLADRILAALRPVRGPVRGLDLASKAQSADDFPSLGGGSSISTSDGATLATAMPSHEPAGTPRNTPRHAEVADPEPAHADPPGGDPPGTGPTTTSATMADLSELDLLSKKKLPAPVKGKEKSVAKSVSKVRLPGRGPEKTSPTGLRAEPPQAAPAESSRLNDQPMDFEITAEQQEIRDRLTAMNAGAMDSHNNIISVDDQENTEEDADRARERRHFDQAIRTASRISDDQNRRLDGIPRRQADGQANPKQPKTTEEVHLTEVTEEEILHAVVESRLSSEEKKAFTEAKRKALTPWSENDAWRAVRRDKCPKGTVVPMRFLLRYKEDKPNARVILQGFKHKDVLESKLDTESPTISRLGKYLMVLMACCMKWRIGTMDVKSAFLQSDYIHQEVELYGEPSADMRRLLVEMVGLKEHEVMQMTKPAFGDVRAPRQWNETADAALTSEVGLLKHELDGCIYVSVRLPTAEDHKFKVFEMDGCDYVVDGLFGLHVDDIMACGEWVTRAEDAKAPEGDKPCCFAERLHVLLHRFKFGSIEYHDQQTFCGTQMTQAMDGS